MNGLFDVTNEHTKKNHRKFYILFLFFVCVCFCCCWFILVVVVSVCLSECEHLDIFPLFYVPCAMCRCVCERYNISWSTLELPKALLIKFSRTSSSFIFQLLEFYVAHRMTWIVRNRCICVYSYSVRFSKSGITAQGYKYTAKKKSETTHTHTLEINFKSNLIMGMKTKN